MHTKTDRCDQIRIIQTNNPRVEKVCNKNKNKTKTTTKENKQISKVIIGR